METARKAQRVALESLYDRTYQVWATVPRKRPNGSTQMVYEAVTGEIPCRLSYDKVTSATETETVAVISQAVTLFCRSDVEILPGSEIRVTKNGKTNHYKSSGKPAVYDSHQEVPLVVFDGRA